MAKINGNYESMIVFSVKDGEEAAKTLVTKFKDMIEANAELKSVDEWGKRKLAYDIKYESEGYYVVFKFTAKPDFPAELTRVLNITDGVLRSMVITDETTGSAVKADEPVEEEAAAEPETAVEEPAEEAKPANDAE